MRLAITGHRDLDDLTTARVDTDIRALLAAYGDRVTGISCLAAGADQIFARAVLDAGGRLEVIEPAVGYAATLGALARQGFDELRSRAAKILKLANPLLTSASYRDAGLAMLDRADALVAVWDGAAARGLGGTAEIVAYAHRRQMTVHLIWPPGATRTG